MTSSCHGDDHDHPRDGGATIHAPDNRGVWQDALLEIRNDHREVIEGGTVIRYQVRQQVSVTRHRLSSSAQPR